MNSVIYHFGRNKPFIYLFIILIPFLSLSCHWVTFSPEGVALHATLSSQTNMIPPFTNSGLLVGLFHDQNAHKYINCQKMDGIHTFYY